MLGARPLGRHINDERNTTTAIKWPPPQLKAAVRDNSVVRYNDSNNKRYAYQVRIYVNPERV